MNRLRWFSFLVLMGLNGIFSAPGGGAEKASAPGSDKDARVAVVIGNSNYPSGALTNPKNDATVMAAALKKLGFDVELKLDGTKAELDGVFKRFSAKAEKARVAALFYAGHGIQVGGSNYLVPIDANPRHERDLKREMVKMDDIIDDMGDARVKLVFFDACRDNPLSRSFSRGGSRGMAAPVEATGTLISFATKHGNTAADGEGKHSPYTTALLEALENPSGVEIEQLLRRVQQGVKLATQGQQEPWRYGSLDGDFYFKAADATAEIVEMERRQKVAVERAVQDAMLREKERAERDKVELQQSLKAQKEASERAMADAIKAQQEASAKAVAEAIKRSNEQAARERAELQASMEKVLKEALARQNAALEAERVARAAASGEAARAQVAAPASGVAVTIPQKPILLASVAPTGIGGNSGAADKVLAALSNAPGDEWEYLSNDEKFGKKQKLILRVKAASADGALEELVWNDKPFLEWVFGARATAIGTPNESEFMFAPHWDGSEFSDLPIEGGRSICTSPGMSCQVSLKVSGTEKLTIAAGTFDAIRLEGHINMRNSGGAGSGLVTIWYSKDQRRLLKQVAKKYSGRIQFNETLELSAIRRAPR